MERLKQLIIAIAWLFGSYCDAALAETSVSEIIYGCPGLLGRIQGVHYAAPNEAWCLDGSEPILLRTQGPVGDRGPAGVPGPPGPLADGFPDDFTIELKGDGFGKSDVDEGSKIAIAAILGFLGTFVTGALVAFTNFKVASLRSDSAKKLQEMEHALNKEIEEREQTHNLEVLRREHDHNNQIEDRRLDQARLELASRTGASGLELELAAARLVDDRRFREAESIHLFFDRLLSPEQSKRDLALFALSNLIDPQALSNLAAGGDEVVSRRSLSKLASQRSGDSVGDIAQRILNAEALRFRVSVVQVAMKGERTPAATGFLCNRPDLLITFAISDLGSEVEVLDHSQNRREGEVILVDKSLGLMAVQLDRQMDGAPIQVTEPTGIGGGGATVTALTWLPGRQFEVRVGEWSDMSLRGLSISGLDDPASGTEPTFSRFRIPVEPGTAGAPVLDQNGILSGVIVAGTGDGAVSFSPSPEMISGFVEKALRRRKRNSRRVI